MTVAFRSAKDAAFAERKATMRQLLICRSLPLCRRYLDRLQFECPAAISQPHAMLPPHELDGAWRGRRLGSLVAAANADAVHLQFPGAVAPGLDREGPHTAFGHAGAKTASRRAWKKRPASGCRSRPSRPRWPWVPTGRGRQYRWWAPLVNGFPFRRSSATADTWRHWQNRAAASTCTRPRRSWNRRHGGRDPLLCR